MMPKPPLNEAGGPNQVESHVSNMNFFIDVNARTRFFWMPRCEARERFPPFDPKRCSRAICTVIKPWLLLSLSHIESCRVEFGAGTVARSSSCTLELRCRTLTLLGIGMAALALANTNLSGTQAGIGAMLAVWVVYSALQGGP